MRALLLVGTFLFLAGCAMDSATSTIASSTTPVGASKFERDLGLQNTPWGRLRVLQELHPLKTVAPHYPSDLRHIGISGTVVLDILVDETGRPVELGVSKSSGYPGFDESASRCISGWRWPIWFEEGKPSKVVVRKLIGFTVN